MSSQFKLSPAGELVEDFKAKLTLQLVLAGYLSSLRIERGNNLIKISTQKASTSAELSGWGWDLVTHKVQKSPRQVFPSRSDVDQGELGRCYYGDQVRI